MDLQHISHGIVCFTFDDSHYHNWLKAMPLFEQYHAEATFFFSGNVDPEMADAMKKLQKNGHSIGLHTLTHADAPEYCMDNGIDAYLHHEILPQYHVCQKHEIPINSFAYPNNKHAPSIDQYLRIYFKLFRAGVGDLKDCSLAECDPLYRDVDALQEDRVMASAGIGEFYHTRTDDLLNAIRRAARDNKIISFFSHDIYPDAP